HPVHHHLGIADGLGRDQVTGVSRHPHHPGRYRRPRGDVRLRHYHRIGGCEAGFADPAFDVTVYQENGRQPQHGCKDEIFQAWLHGSHSILIVVVAWRVMVWKADTTLPNTRATLVAIICTVRLLPVAPPTVGKVVVTVTPGMTDGPLPFGGLR